MWHQASTPFGQRPYRSNLTALGQGLSHRIARSAQLLNVIAATLLAIPAAGGVSTDSVTRWNQLATDASTVANPTPLRESCIFAILHVAIHDAVNAVELRYEPYLPGT